MKHTILLAAATLLIAPAGHAQNASARNLAASCAICHGTDGRTSAKDIVPLAGQTREHIASRLRAFRDGLRPATVMHQIAKGYSDEQIDAMAAWFASQGP